MYFYLSPGGTPRVPVALYSVAILFTGTINALVTPPIGYLSDYTRSRWGRRLPYMFASALPMLALFVLLWTPPVSGQSIWNLVYLAVILGLYRITYCFNQVPYSALLPELALTDQHRVRMSLWTTIFMLLGVTLSSFVGPILDYLEKTMHVPEGLAYATTALLYAVVLLPLFYLPFFVLRERPDRQIASTERLNFWQSIGLTLRNPAFQVLTATGALYWIVTAFVQAIIPFIVTEICLLPKAHTLYFYILGVLVSLACYPLITRLSSRFGKWRVATGSMLAAAFVLPGLMLIGDWLPVPLAAQGVTWITLEAIALSGVYTLPSLPNNPESPFRCSIESSNISKAGCSPISPISSDIPTTLNTYKPIIPPYSMSEISNPLRGLKFFRRVLKSFSKTSKPGSPGFANSSGT